MKEITREQFWKLEDLVASCEMQKFTGELQVEHHGEGKLYKNSRGKWFRSIPEQNLYLADSKLLSKYKKVL